MQLHHMVVPLLVVWLGFSHAAIAPDVEPQIGWSRPRLDLNPGPHDSAPEPGVVEIPNSVREEELGLVVSAWNEQALEFDELTRCIRGSETGNAIERWLDCLASLEGAPASSFALKPSQATPRSPVCTDLISSDADVDASLLLADDTSMGAFDPLSVGSARSQNSDTSDENSDGVQGLGSAMANASDRTAQERFSEESQNLKAAALSEDEGSGVEAGPWSGRGGELEGIVELGRTGASASPEMSLEDNGLAGEGDTRGAPDVRRSSLKWGTDISPVSGDSRSPPSSGCDEDGGCPEVPTEALSSTKRTQNLLDAMKLAACVGAAVTLMWRRRGRLWPREKEKEKQAVLSEGAVDYPCPSATGFSVTTRSSSNTEIGYLTVRAGSLSTPLGMAIATVMAEARQHEYGEREPRTADELSKLLEAAMTESLSPVMGGECLGFVDQFKQSFRSTYRLLGSVRNASGRNPAPLSFSNRSGSFSQRRSEGPSRRYYRRTDDEEDDNSGLTSSSRVAYLDPAFECDSMLHSRVDPDSESDLAEQLSRLTFSAKRPGTAANTKHGSPAPLRNTQGGARDGDNWSHIDQEAFEEFDDVSSPLRRDTSEGLSENVSGYGASRVHQNGVRSRWGRGGLEQLANVGSAEGVASPSASEQVGRQQGGGSLEFGELELALQPVGMTPRGQLVAASESSLSHHGGETRYKQQKIELMQQEMHLRKMELAYKFRDLHLKESNLELSSESNSMMRETVDLSRIRAEFKEAEFRDRKLTAAYTELAKRCADEMVAGLCVMLCAIFFGAWKYSNGRLVDVVSVCQRTLYEPSNSYVPGFNKVVDYLNHMTSHLQMLACEVTVASRMFLGLGIISVVAASLLRKSVTSNSQAMPATILIVVLGGICGVAGKFAVDSMGGSGYHWLVLWETFCLVHTSATCLTATLYRILNGVPPSATGKSHRPPYLMRPWWRRFWFHVTIVLVLPTLMGLLPFAHVREIVEVLGLNLWNLTYSPLESYLRKNSHISLV